MRLGTAARFAALVALLALALGPAAPAQRMVGGTGPPSQWGDAPCSGHGHQNIGRCFCDPRWTGAECDMPEAPLDCGAHGKVSRSRCVCDVGWKGRTCQVEQPPCAHGRIAGAKCVCDPGWSGDACSARAEAAAEPATAAPLSPSGGAAPSQR